MGTESQESKHFHFLPAPLIYFNCLQSSENQIVKYWHQKHIKRQAQGIFFAEIELNFR